MRLRVFLARRKKGLSMFTYKQKLEQTNREAIATVIALVITIVVWVVCGFGLAGLDITLFHTPLWVIGGTIGTWICSIVVAVVLAKKVFVGFDLDDENNVSDSEGEVCHE